MSDSGKLVADDESTDESTPTEESTAAGEDVEGLAPHAPDDIVLSPAPIKQFEFSWTAAPGANSGAVYVYTRDPLGAWSQQAYVKAPSTGQGDGFGWAVALSGDGQTLAVGARAEESHATGIGGDQSDNSMTRAGAVYLF